MLFGEHISNKETAYMYAGLFSKQELFKRTYPIGVSMVKFYALHYVNGYRTFKNKYSK